MTTNTINIDGVEYIRKDSVTGTGGDIKIVVLDRGFVYVGYVAIEEEFIVIRHAKNIRYWGTKNGLGELVNGPLPETKLDPAGTVRAAKRALISLIDVEQSKWKLL